MTTPPLKFEIATADRLKIDDSEISDLLTQVYVGGGFTTSEEAASLFEPSAVRERGVLIGARENQQSKLAGIIIVVPPDSPARRLAKNNEAELHLLGVRPEYRQHGLGRILVDAAIENTSRLGYSKLILWTQLSMSSAQRLYESAGFVHMSNIERNGREFKVYERALCA
jgi:ribosomal protein S18 acetylase RimI-like enzyme